MGIQNPAVRRFEVTKLEERVAPSSFSFGGFSINYNVSGGSISGSVTLPNGTSYSGSFNLGSFNLGSFLHF